MDSYFENKLDKIKGDILNLQYNPIDLAGNTFEASVESLIQSINNHDLGAVQFLAYHLAARSLCMWEVNCPDIWPRTALGKVKHYLMGKMPAGELTMFIDPAKPCVDDCRYGEAASASEAVAYAAAFMIDGCLPTATAVAMATYCAFDQVGLANTELFPWLFEVAIPYALEKKFMNGEALSRFMTNQHTAEMMHSLCPC